MARLKYNQSEAEQIFQKHNVDARNASPTSAVPDAIQLQLQQEMQDLLANPDTGTKIKRKYS